MSEEIIDQSEAQGMAPMAQDSVHAGFPSPAQDYMTGFFDLNKELVRHPEATFYARVSGDSMVDAGVDNGDILVIDRSLEAREGDMAVCFVDGEFALKYISFSSPGAAREESSPAKASYRMLPRRELWLLPANDKYSPIHIGEGNDFTVWGIVSYIIKKPSRRL